MNLMDFPLNTIEEIVTGNNFEIIPRLEIIPLLKKHVLPKIDEPISIIAASQKETQLLLHAINNGRILDTTLITNIASFFGYAVMLDTEKRLSNLIDQSPDHHTHSVKTLIQQEQELKNNFEWADRKLNSRCPPTKKSDMDIIVKASFAKLFSHRIDAHIDHIKKRGITDYAKYSLTDLIQLTGREVTQEQKDFVTSLRPKLKNQDHLHPANDLT